MNAYQHAIETKRIALNDMGLLAWVKHNHDAIMEALRVCNDIRKVNDEGFTKIHAEIHKLPIPQDAFSPALDFEMDNGF